MRCVRGWWLLKSQTLCRRKKRELAPVLSRRAVFEYRKLPSRKFLCAAPRRKRLDVALKRVHATYVG